jgi:hypothetical protein
MKISVRENEERTDTIMIDYDINFSSLSHFNTIPQDSPRLFEDVGSNIEV